MKAAIVSGLKISRQRQKTYYYIILTSPDFLQFIIFDLMPIRYIISLLFCTSFFGNFLRAQDKNLFTVAHDIQIKYPVEEDLKSMLVSLGELIVSKHFHLYFKGSSTALCPFPPNSNPPFLDFNTAALGPFLWGTDTILISRLFSIRVYEQWKIEQWDLCQTSYKKKMLGFSFIYQMPDGLKSDQTSLEQCYMEPLQSNAEYEPVIFLMSPQYEKWLNYYFQHSHT